MSEVSPATVVVIGGGITGLVAARRVRMLSARTRVVLLERGARLGGKIRTDRIAGVPIEAGADWFLTRQPAALELCRELRIDDHLVPPDRSGAFVWSRGTLRRLIPSLVRGVPTKPLEALRTGLLTPLGATRAARDLLSRDPLSGEDVSIGSFVRNRFGAEVLERLVDPVLAASRSGSADEMSLAAAAPELDRAARSHPSVIRGLRAASQPAGSTPPFLGLRGGMAGLVEALAKDLRGVEVRSGTTVTGLARRDGGYVVRTDAEEIAAPAVIVAAPAFAAARLVQSFDATLSGELARIRYAPAVVVTLVYPAGAGTPPSQGSGMLVPSKEGRTLTACAWFSEKWSHARPPDGRMVLRCFVGGPEASALPDDALVDAITWELGEVLHLAGPPTEADITRWDAGLPVYRVGHLELMDRIEERARAHPGLTLAGAGYRGSGLPDCISQGARAAEVAVASLGAEDP